MVRAPARRGAVATFTAGRLKDPPPEIQATPDQGPQICVLGATFNTGNMGVSALTAGTIACILHRYPEAKISLLDYGREGLQACFQLRDRRVPVQFVNMRFSKKFYLPNNIALLILLALALKFLPWEKIRKRLIVGNSCLRHIHEADFAASIAGGDSFSDTYGLGRLLYVALPQILVLLSGKKLILLPQTVGPFRRKFAKAIAKYILARAELIYSRDFAGQDAVRKLLGRRYTPSKVGFCYDVAFAVDPRVPANQGFVGLTVQEPKDSPLVGLNVSGLLVAGGYTRNNMFGLKVDYETLIYSLIEFLIDRKKASVLLVPHVVGGEEDVESDSVASERIYQVLRRKYGESLGLVRGSYDPGEIKYIIGSCDFFVGSRMHACIAAVSQYVPAVSIAYSDKFIGVMETLGIASLVTDARKMSHQEILASIDRAYADRDFLRRQLEARIPEVRRTVLNLFQNSWSFLAKAP